MRLAICLALVLAGCVSTRYTAETVQSAPDLELCRLTDPSRPTVDHELLLSEVGRRDLDCSEVHENLARSRASPPGYVGGGALPPCAQPTGNPTLDGFILGQQAAGRCAPTGRAPPQAARHRVCLTYQETGRVYSVEGSVVLGRELNQSAYDAAYHPYQRYLVVFWGPGEATVIRPQWPIAGDLPYLPSPGVDQQGREWTFQADTGLCG